MSGPTDRPVLGTVPPGAPGAGSEGTGSLATAGEASPPDEREAWAVLLSVHGLGPAGFGALLAAYGSGRAILAAASLRGAAARFARIAAEGDGRPPFREPVGEGIVAVAAELASRLAVLRASGLAIVTLDDPGYPARLRAIALPPPVVLVRGDVGTLSADHAVAIVGTRRPTERGRLVAARIGAAISNAGAVVVSGLAVGIDGAAHAAVAAEQRPTVAVLGSGHGRLFPRAHQRLATEIVAAGGAVVSELWPDQQPSKDTFPQRNRVISGLADATIVVEAGLRSGALITAKWALEQGRGLFLVPGPIDEPRSAGCLHWLREYPGEAGIVATLPELITDLGLVGPAGVDSTGPAGCTRARICAPPWSRRTLDAWSWTTSRASTLSSTSARSPTTHSASSTSGSRTASITKGRCAWPSWPSRRASSASCRCRRAACTAYRAIGRVRRTIRSSPSRPTRAARC
jgi:DNA processing protein